MNELTAEALYENYHGKVFGYLLERTGNREDAEDLCSTVFEKLCRVLLTYDREKASLSTWVYTVTRNTFLDYCRRRRPSEILPEEPEAGEDLEERLIRTESLERLAEALGRMPRPERDIIVLRYYDGRPLTEIAELMNLSYGAVKLRHQNAVLMLRQALAD